MQQIVEEPNHILAESSSCIDLFMFQKSLVIESGVHSFRHSICHHQMTYAKFDLKTYYPPNYERDEVWHYEQANVSHIRKAVDPFL